MFHENFPKRKACPEKGRPSAKQKLIHKTKQVVSRPQVECVKQWVEDPSNTSASKKALHYKQNNGMAWLGKRCTTLLSLEGKPDQKPACYTY
jgi:hypothetical protein